jgi:succinate dehydrogenase / fumarate reductase membrane anchor subunit
MTFESDLHKAEGLGSAKSGVNHWIMQRVTALALIPLGIWFVGYFTVILTSPYELAQSWLKSPWSAALSILFIYALFYHGYLGMQVIFEDYVQDEKRKWALIIATKFISIMAALLSILSILKVLFS